MTLHALTLCSFDEALDILQRPLPPKDTVGTRTCLKQCHKLFQIFNNNLEVDPTCYKQLISIIMLSFDNWYKETKQTCPQATGGLKSHWKKVVPQITYKDLKRNIRTNF